LTPALEQVATALACRAKLVRVNVESAPQLIHRFTVKGLPTLLVLYRDERWHARAA